MSQSPTSDSPKSVARIGCSPGQLKNETVLVTGAGGYMASHVVYQLLVLGYKVKGTVRNPAKEPSWGHLKKCHKMLFPHIDVDGPEKRLFMERGDLLNDEQSHWDALVKGCDYIIHTASPFAMKESEEVLVKTAIRGTELVLLAAGKNLSQLKKVVLTSSVASVMVGHTKQRQREAPFTGKDWSVVENTHGYELSKFKAEKRAWEIQKEFGFQMDVVCPGLIIGPIMAKHHVDCESSKTLKVLVENTMGVGADLRIPVTDVRDVAELHIRAAVTPQGLNHTGGRYLSACSDSASSGVMELAAVADKLLRDKSGYRPTRIQLPTMLVKLIANFHPDLQHSQAWLGAELVADTSEAQDDLGMVFRPYGPAVEQHILSMMQFGYDSKGFDQETIDQLEVYDKMVLKQARTTSIN